MNNIKISFIIITWNGLHYMRDLLESMTEVMERKNVEVIVVDNGSSDGTPSFIRQKYHNTILIELPQNKGVAFARNRGLEIARGQYLFIIDNDMIMNTHTIDGMIDYMENNPQVGICGCKLVFKNGVTQESCKSYPGFILKAKRLLHIGVSHFNYHNKMDSPEPFEVVYLIGACQLLRREAYTQTGALDEEIFYGPEDCDYCLRVHNNGWKIMYIPQYKLIHYCQRMTNTRPFSKMGLHHIFGLLYLYWKYKHI